MASIRYQASIDLVRGRGCSCMLIWNEAQQSAVPVTRDVDSEACPANHYQSQEL